MTATDQVRKLGRANFSTCEQIGFFQLQVDEHGVATLLFDRPPVNAVSLEVYRNLGEVIDRVEGDNDVRVVVLTAPLEQRAWCGGADLNDFVGIDKSGRHARYEFINTTLPRLARVDRPTIAAINGPAIGIGTVIAAMCDMRVAAKSAVFRTPEIDYGLVGGGPGLLSFLNLPEGLIREMHYTGRNFDAKEMARAGFLNEVVKRSEVLPRALELARSIAQKSLPGLKARKRVFNDIEGRTWMESYLIAQEVSGNLVTTSDAGEGVHAFLEGRSPEISDN